MHEAPEPTQEPRDGSSGKKVTTFRANAPWPLAVEPWLDGGPAGGGVASFVGTKKTRKKRWHD